MGILAMLILAAFAVLRFRFPASPVVGDLKVTRPEGSDSEAGEPRYLLPRGPVHSALLREAGIEWPSGENHSSARSGTDPNQTDGASCSQLLDVNGLCDPSLLRLPPRRAASAAGGPFVFLHLSKCAGTSLFSSLVQHGSAAFSLRLPPGLATATPCGAEESAKCCWWRERMNNLSATGEDGIRILTQEPANDEKWLAPPDATDKSWHVKRVVDPGFEAGRDLCRSPRRGGTFAYLTILRRPVPRVHSHMCEVGVGFPSWLDQQRSTRFQDTKGGGAHVDGRVRLQLRDNYFVRALGGDDAWEAPEGGLRVRHLHAAARALAQFDVVMTVETLQRDAPAQMGRVGFPGFRPRHVYSRSRADNLERAVKEPWLRDPVTGRAACEARPTRAELERLVQACAWDAVLYEFARLLAARRSEAYRREQVADHAHGAG